MFHRMAVPINLKGQQSPVPAHSPRVLKGDHYPGDEVLIDPVPVHIIRAHYKKFMKIILFVLLVVWTSSSTGCTFLQGKNEIEEASTGEFKTAAQFGPSDEYSTKSERPLYRVWYGTNRKPLDNADLTEGFSSHRDKVLHYGNVIVYVPESHQFGSTGSSWASRVVRLTDDRLKIEQINPLSQDEFLAELNGALMRNRPKKRRVLLYIHGYNCDFDEAVIRAAQMGYDLKVEGVTAVYSWPSKGNWSPWGYEADQTTIESSEDFLAEFATKLALESKAEEVDIIAHSMGNRALLRAVNALAAAMGQARKKLGQIILAAPDVDADVFSKLATIYPTVSSRTTLYTSTKDLALQASAFFHQYDRAGFYPPIMLIPGIDTVQVSNVELTLLGHSYYAQAGTVLNDMFDLIHDNKEPNKRIRLYPRPSKENTKYWEIAP